MPRQLTAEHEAAIERIMALGDYADADEVIGKALCRPEDDHRRLQWLRAELAIAEEQERRGELIEFTPERFEEIKRQAVENARLGLPIKDAVKP